MSVLPGILTNCAAGNQAHRSEGRCGDRLLGLNATSVGGIADLEQRSGKPQQGSARQPQCTRHVDRRRKLNDGTGGVRFDLDEAARRRGRGCGGVRLMVSGVAHVARAGHNRVRDRQFLVGAAGPQQYVTAANGQAQIPTVPIVKSLTLVNEKPGPITLPAKVPMSLLAVSVTGPADTTLSFEAAIGPEPSCVIPPVPASSFSVPDVAVIAALMSIHPSAPVFRNSSNGLVHVTVSTTEM